MVLDPVYDYVYKIISFYSGFSSGWIPNKAMASAAEPFVKAMIYVPHLGIFDLRYNGVRRVHSRIHTHLVCGTTMHQKSTDR